MFHLKCQPIHFEVRVTIPDFVSKSRELKKNPSRYYITQLTFTRQSAEELFRSPETLHNNRGSGNQGFLNPRARKSCPASLGFIYE